MKRRTDPGYYLTAEGRSGFEAALGFRPSVWTMAGRAYSSLGVGGYAGAGAIVALLLLGFPVLFHVESTVNWILLGVLGLLGAVPAIDSAVALVNQGVTRQLGATLIPGLELRGGVPAALRTLVVVPTLLTRRDAVLEQVERLEIHYLASIRGEVQFALLSDWPDAASENIDGDHALLQTAVDAIARLNRRHAPAPGGDRFILLHRHRVWNESQRMWIGWERKRGKLHELNRLLRGARDTTFLNLDGCPPTVPDGVQFVVTLDSDTRLPPDSMRRLIGKMAHPLNQPIIDRGKRRVTEGYAILQPRVTPNLPVGDEGSAYQRAFSSPSGIDPYSAAVSDVYQDLFGEGSYAGKGIYAVDAFETVLADRVPDSTLLSHDLFEGVFARTGLASDVEVVESYPTRYDEASLRYQRWARGDWQLLPWILGWSALLGKTRRFPATLPASGRWKMVDNLRRSVTPLTGVLALLAGWTLPFQGALVWTLFLLGTIALPSLSPVLVSAGARHPGIPLHVHLARVFSDLGGALAQVLLIVTLLAHQAWLLADAVIRTLVRLFITRRNLLQWTPAAQATIASDPTIGAYYRWMFGAVVTGIVAIVVTLIAGDQTIYLAAPFALLWIASPAVAQWVSRPSSAVAEQVPTDEHKRALRLIARRTWRYFETFVTPGDHMLPPDNFQETPSPVLARRTSPTNIGLYLLATASAHDFGWTGAIETIDRLDATMATMAILARYRGHFYNWYDTESLRALDPQYVSSVDSGNLAGHLIALANACQEWCKTPIADAKRLEGIVDALNVAREEVEALRDRRRTETVTWRQLDDSVAHIFAELNRAQLKGETLTVRLAALAGTAETLVDLAGAFSIERGKDSSDILFWAQAVRDSIVSHQRDLSSSDDLASRFSAIGRKAREMALAMEFGFLLNEERLLLSVGFVVRDAALDESCYDLLASEARLASFIAIAKGDLAPRHWFRLGHGVTPLRGGAALLSWSGSMFEYLMPALVMRAPTESIIGLTNRAVVRRQIEYATARSMPWGISESAYNARDLHFTYQYSNFGIPGLGLKRGLGEDAVVAPYATALAAIVEPVSAANNFRRMADDGARGRFGFFEALDYTPRRLPEGQTVAIVRAFMAHHQGMTIVAIADALLGGKMRKRFHSEPIVRAAELLLHERMPREIATLPSMASDAKPVTKVRDIETMGAWRQADPNAATPVTHLLSNGRYSVMLTAGGSGYSRWRDLAVTRWREDSTCDDWGSYFYLRDVESDRLWSPTYQPTSARPDQYTVAFSEERATFSRQDGDIHTTLEVVVSTEDEAEVRRLTIVNNGSRSREIEVTSYAEIAIAPQAADSAHPAFSKLFVETEYVGRLGAILATRRRRSPDEPEIWAAHHSVASGERVGKAEFETDRARFLGRGFGVRTPAAVTDGRILSSSTGAVLDPIFALRRRVHLAPGAAVHIDFWTLVAESRDALLDVVDKTNDISAFDRAVTLAWTQAQVQLHHLDIDRNEASEFQRLAGALIYATPTLRPSSEVIMRGAGPQSALWSQGISGDLPIILLRIADVEDIGIVHQLLQAMEYWRTRRLEVDLVILNERDASYVQDLQAALETTLRTREARPPASAEGVTGKVFVLRADLIPPDTCALLASVARVRLSGDGGGLAEQLNRIKDTSHPARAPRKASVRSQQSPAAPVPKLEYFNGIGGFGIEGSEYVITLGPGQSTPAPWINVIANPGFGFQVSAEGGSFTWSVNSREHQLSPWSNDPVTDPPGEAIYLRDDDSGEIWSPTALPVREDSGIYVASHGWGYSRFEHEGHGIRSELLTYVPVADPIRISRLKLRNTSDRLRHLSVTAYVAWVLGTSRAVSAPFISTEIDPVLGAMFARNPWNAAFAGRVAFLDLGGKQESWTADRREFIGRNGCLSNPAGLDRPRLSGAVGAGFDPCGAMLTTVELAPNAETEIVILLGDADGPEKAAALIAHYRDADLDAVLAEVHEQWANLLGTVQVKTPDRSMDIMLNGWLLYQTIACRLWARSAFYQASGAYGFRDQLQDGMAVAAVSPTLTREHLIRAAGRQFAEGDVQHWWLPHSGQGVRTRISDDRLWLVYCAAHYIETTGDAALLDETVPFLDGPKLKEGEQDSFFTPTVSDRVASVYEHCALALDASLAVGAHGLPLIGTGDWNDGMNRVGEGGKGESVWLAWLSHMALTQFAAVAKTRGEAARALKWRGHASALQKAIEREAWDGGWYRRAWFDDGTVIGSATNDECRIDSIAQSWGVMSGIARPERARRAMAAVERELIRPDERLALLFTPPFDRTLHDPGYIKGYPPGIRENGGQYTHGAIWSVIALARLGDGAKAADLFSQLNPINHSRNRSDLRHYKVEPYVVVADVYAAADHVGRGGWTWYTGSAAWLYRAGMEEILGLRMAGSSLHLDPCIPEDWPGFEVKLRRGSTRFDIRVDNPAGVTKGIASAQIDGREVTERPLRFDLPEDGESHVIQVSMG